MKTSLEGLKIRKNEIALLFATIPLLLLLLFSMPQEVKQDLALDVSNLSPQGIFLSNYVHEDFSHFTQNVFGYYIGMFFVYYFYFLRGRSGLLHSLFPVFVVLPFLASFLHLVALPTLRNLGYSAIVAAIYGALPVVFLEFAEFRYKLKLNRVWSLWSIFFINMLLIAGIYGHAYLTLMVGVFTAVFLYLTIRFVVKNNGIRKIVGGLRVMEKVLLALGLTFSMFGTIMFFPANIVSENEVVNIFSHYVGYVFGFVTFWVLYMRQKP